MEHKRDIMLSMDFNKSKIDSYLELSNNWVYSRKHDGICVYTTPGQPLTRSGKTIPNPYLRDYLSKLPAGLQGEICALDPFREDAFKISQSMVMTKHITEEKHNELFAETQFMIFNAFDYSDDCFNSSSYLNRLQSAELRTSVYDYCNVVKLKVGEYGSRALLNHSEALAKQLGAEGLILTYLEAPYLFGRSTNKLPYSLKVKNMADCDGIIVGYETEKYGENLKTVPPELWGKEKPLVSKLLLETERFGTIRVGSGLTKAQKSALYHNPNYYLGKTCTVEYLNNCIKDKPRQPVLKVLDRKDT